MDAATLLTQHLAWNLGSAPYMGQGNLATSHGRAGNPALLHRVMKLGPAPRKEREPWLCLIGGAGNPASQKEWEPWLRLTDRVEKTGRFSE